MSLSRLAKAIFPWGKEWGRGCAWSGGAALPVQTKVFIGASDELSQLVAVIKEIFVCSISFSSAFYWLARSELVNDEIALLYLLGSFWSIQSWDLVICYPFQEWPHCLVLLTPYKRHWVVVWRSVSGFTANRLPPGIS